MRGLLRDFADRGGTVLLSSHLLHEIEVIADDLVVIGNGRIVAQGTKAELLGRPGPRPRPAPRPSPPPWSRRASRTARRGRRPAHRRRPRRVGEVALARAALPSSAADGAGLEEMFLELTADTQREGVAA